MCRCFVGRRIAVCIIGGSPEPTVLAQLAFYTLLHKLAKVGRLVWLFRQLQKFLLQSAALFGFAHLILQTLHLRR